MSAIATHPPESGRSAVHHNATFAIEEADARKRPVRKRPIADIRTVSDDAAHDRL
jgi:hypothetical protein